MNTTKKKGFVYTLKKNKVAYAYVAPFYILFAIFGLFPIVAGFGLSFFRWDGIGPMHFNGVTNYINLFKDSLFWKALSNTLLIGILAHIPILLGGLALAYILNSKLVEGENIFKTIYFMPMVTSSVAISIIFQNLFGNNYGIINWFLSLFGQKAINWLGGDGSLIKVAVIVMFAWKWVGWNMVIYLAGMQVISGDIYEAAKIDGANGWQKFRYITFPLLKPTTVYVVTISVFAGLSMFLESFMIWGGNNSPKNIGLTIVGYLYRRGIEKNDMGYACAVGVVLMVIALVINFVQLIATGTFHIGKKKED